MELGQIDAAATTLVLRTSKYLGDDKNYPRCEKSTGGIEIFVVLFGCSKKDARDPRRRKFCYAQIIICIFVYIYIHYGKLVASHRGSMQKNM